MSESIIERIEELKQRRRAVILAHNYQRPEVQDIADYTGDSLELSRKAADVEAEVIVFCGVHFMAETASILCPEKVVLLPDPEAGCPMADMITAEELRKLREKHPGAAAVCYVNSTAEVKAESDCCCTSANAVDVVNSMGDAAEIIFVPDQYLGQHVSELTGRDMILWQGYCPTHVRILDRDIAAARQAHPGAVVMAHPECTKPVRDAADQVLSTGGMCRFAGESCAREFIVATEEGILHRLRTENPGKSFFTATDRGVCPNMKRITLEKLMWSLEEMQPEVRVPKATGRRAAAAIQKMLSI